MQEMLRLPAEIAPLMPHDSILTAFSGHPFIRSAADVCSDDHCKVMQSRMW